MPSFEFLYRPQMTFNSLNRFTMPLAILFTAIFCGSIGLFATDEDKQNRSIIVVQGAGGSPQFDNAFRDSCSKIESAAKKAKIKFQWIGGEPKSSDQKSDRDKLKEAVDSNLEAKSQLWLILIGHGTFSRNAAKFNLRGPDLAAEDLTKWLEAATTPVAIVNCASSSAPFINSLSGPNRVVVTATKSGFEISFARFGEYFAEGITNLEADIDKDEQVSLLESFLFASKKVEEFYKSESRLSTEHALIDDNGDGKGTPLEFFRGVRVVIKSKDDAIPDGIRANQLHLIESDFEQKLPEEIKRERNKLELEIETLRAEKSSLPEAEYYAKLEIVMTQLAQLYAAQEESTNKKTGEEKPSQSKPIKKAANSK